MTTEPVGLGRTGEPTPSARLLAELVESAPDAMVVADAEGRILLANKQTEALFGYPRPELIGNRIEILVPERDRGVHERHRTEYTHHPLLRPMGSGRTLYAQRKDGTEFAIEISLAPLNLDDSTAVAAVVRDVSARVSAQEELERLALHDHLTGLANRALVMERLERSLSRRRRGTGRTAVVFIDVDRLKWVNDSLGHDAGDVLIKAVAERLRDTLRPSDTVGRFGGDEFVAVVDDVGGLGDVLTLAHRLLAAVRRPVHLGGTEIRPSISLGIAVTEENHPDPQALVHQADAAMYQAKRNGRDRFEIYERRLESGPDADLDLHAELSRAVRTGGLDVLYQPVIDLRTGRTWGVESLVRWTRDGHADVAAEHLVSLAEQSSLILELDRLVLTRACAEMARLGPERIPRVGVNVSARHLSAGDLPAMVTEALAAGGLPPSALWIELTESEQLAHEESRAALEELIDLGVMVAIDDFGTGFSSLSRLRDLPVRLLKVDRGFIAGVESDFRRQALVAAVVTLAHGLGQHILAEGVETPEQVAVLQRLGCDLGQGFHWTEALHPDDLKAWSESRSRLQIPAPRR